MFDAFTYGKNIWVRSLHGIVHYDSPLYMQAAVIGQPDFGTNTSSHNNKIGPVGRIVFQQDRLDFVFADDRARVSPTHHLYAAGFQLFLQ